MEIKKLLAGRTLQQAVKQIAWTGRLRLHPTQKAALESLLSLLVGELPPVPRAESVVYFLYSPATDMVKIGVTTQLRARISDLNTAHGVELQLLLLLPGDRLVERRMHRRFADLRAGREWFKAEESLLQFIADERGIGDAATATGI